MSFVSAALTGALSTGLADVATVGAMVLALFVVLFTFKRMAASVTPKTITRRGSVYELDKEYVSTLPKYQYLDGQRYVLKEPSDADDPYEVDGEEENLDHWAERMRESNPDFFKE